MRHSVACVLIPAVLATLVGCVQPPSPTPTPEPNVIMVSLGDVGDFTSGLSSSVENSGSFDVSADVPQEDPSEIRVSIDAADIALGTAADFGTNGEVTALLLLSFGDPDEAEPCVALGQLHYFDLIVDSTGVTSVSPESATISGAAFSAVRSGEFSLCLAGTASAEIPLTISALRLRFVQPGEIVATSCAEIFALAEVQSAASELAAAGTTFTLPNGISPPNIEGTYALSQTTTFDPDGDSVNNTLTGTLTFDQQTTTTVRRSGFDASVEQYIAGDATSVALCTLQRTHHAPCDQTIARIESHAYDSSTGDLAGNFLAVAVRRHAYTDATCGASGSFIYGDIELEAQQLPALAEVRGKVDLPDTVNPDLLALSGANAAGAVTDFDNGKVYRFGVTSPFAATEIVLPDDLAPVGFSALGMAADGSRLAVVTDQPDAAFIYDNVTFDLIRDTSFSTYDYVGARVDFNLDATRLFVPSINDTLADRITVLRADDSSLGDEARRLAIPNDGLPVQARLSPDGEQLAVLLEGGAPVGEAADLTFGDPEFGGFLTTPIDLETDAGGTVLASELLYATDGSRVFLAGLGAVVAVETTSPYTITRIDVSNGAGDNPVALAMSGDGAVLAVAIDDANGDADFAVVDTATLTVLNTQDLPGVGARRALDIAHFGSARIAVVANFESTVTPVRTTSPYTAGEPIFVADTAALNDLGRIEGAGAALAVTNIEEPAVYVLELVSP